LLTTISSQFDGGNSLHIAAASLSLASAKTLLKYKADAGFADATGLLPHEVIPQVYMFYQVYKMIKSCHRYHKRNNPVANRNQEEDYQPLVGNDDDWIADCIENPQEYDEQHVPCRMDDVSEEDQEPITIATAATYGSINETTV
ncbi:PREDICTED: uncharacterized protein LOC109592217, partial [Amphimedon queenslandica]|uniref:uncharacterized protein LOC109592217 n=1 Tax=Amphimedon queenslandica TaxID=400682 RepID=UPI00096B4F7D